MKWMALALLAAAPALSQDTRKAEDLLKDALAQAKESKRLVFLTFGSPG
jgi:hypothetical protein